MCSQCKRALEVSWHGHGKRMSARCQAWNEMQLRHVAARDARAALPPVPPRGDRRPGSARELLVGWAFFVVLIVLGILAQGAAN